jgi:hypothetical protein
MFVSFADREFPDGRSLHFRDDGATGMRRLQRYKNIIAVFAGQKGR